MADNEKIFSIIVSDEGVQYDTEMSPEESIFWLKSVEYMIMNRVFEETAAEQPVG